LLGMECALLAGKTLADDLGIFVYQYAHANPAKATTCSAAWAKSSAA